MEDLIKELKELKISTDIWSDELDINYNCGVNDAIKVVEGYIKKQLKINDESGWNKMLLNNDY